MPSLLIAAVKLELTALTSTSAIAALAQSFVGELTATKLSEVTLAVEAREAQATTFLGYEAALPHARLVGNAPWMLAVGRFPAGVPWGPHLQPVKFVFLSVVPMEAATAYLGFVRDLAKAIRNEGARDRLQAASTTEDVTSWLQTNLHLP